MAEAAKLNVILTSYRFDRADVGETLISYRWAKALSGLVNLTVLGMSRPTPVPLEEQLPGVEVAEWPEPPLLRRAERFNAMAKPGYPLFYRRVRRWVQGELAKGRRFDVAHQLMPQAARYPCPFRGLGVPYIVGPLGGALATPEGFRSEVGSASWYTRLRALDLWRFRYDPWLRGSYREADMILGVAPYFEQTLSAIPLRRFEPVLELGIDALPDPVARPIGPGLRLLHVGRGVRTKGLRDAVRAMAELRDLADVTLTSAGGGEEIAIARAEAEALGIADRITFLGRIPHDQVEDLYRTSDIFVFPSFREPAGGVLYEAMRWGLPVITVDYGGPAYIVDDSCGIRLPVSTPEALKRDVARAVRDLYANPERLRALSHGAHAKLAREGLWSAKAAHLVCLYRDVAQAPPWGPSDLCQHPLLNVARAPKRAQPNVFRT